MTPKKMYASIFKDFTASVVPVDCGEKCRHLNDGIPICCDTDHAVPVMDRSEFKLLRSRSKLWRMYKPSTPDGKEIVDSLHHECVAAVCKGAAFCERDNRSLSCRAFPFFPFISKDDEFLGLAHYWDFEDRCWVISNMQMVTPEFIDEFHATYDLLFSEKPDEKDVFKDFSTNMRRVFSRKRRSIFVIERDHNFLEIKPKGKGMAKVSGDALPKFDPYNP